MHVTAGGEEMAVERLAKQGTEGADEQSTAVQTLATQVPGGVDEPLLVKETGPHEIVHPLPLRWVSDPWTLGRSFYDSAKFGIVQYVSCILD